MAVDIVAVLRASIDDFQAKMAEADASVKTMSDSSTSNFSKMSALGKGAMLGIGAAVVGVGVAAVDFGDKLEMSQNQLQAALKSAGISWDSVKNSVDQTGNAATKYGFTQAQVDDALKLGIISTQNYSEAHRNLSIAIELAAAKHIDLSSAMQMVDKAATGQTRALKQMGIDLPVTAANALKLKNAQDAVAGANLALLGTQEQVDNGTIKASAASAALQKAHDNVFVAETKLKDLQGAHNQILDALSQRLSGQASAAADTFAGRMAAMKAQGENLLAQIGLRLIPILESLMKTIMSVVVWLEHHKAVAEALGIVIGTVLVAAIAVYVAGMISAAAATIAATWPILLIIGIIAALAAAVYEVIDHWGTIAKFFEKLWDDVKGYFDIFWGYIKEWGPLVLEAVLAPFTAGMSLLLPFIISHWAEVQSFFASIPGRIVAVLGDMGAFIWNGLLDSAEWIDDHVLKPVVTWFAGIPARIVAALGNIVAFIWNALLASGTWIDSNVLQPVVNWFVGLPTRIVSGLGNIVAFIWNALLASGSWIDSNVLQPVISYFQSFPGRVASGFGNIVETIFGALTGAWNWIYANVYTPIVNGFSGLGNDIANAIGGALGSLGGVGKDIINAIIGGIDDAINFVNDHRPSILGVPLFPAIPDIPKLAGGGPVGAGNPYIVGEQGPELFIPGSSGSIVPNGALGGGGGPTTVVLQIDGQQFASVVLPSLQSYGAVYQRTVPLPVFGVSNVV